MRGDQKLSLIFTFLRGSTLNFFIAISKHFPYSLYSLQKNLYPHLYLSAPY